MTEAAGEVERRDGAVLRSARSDPEQSGADATYVVQGHVVDDNDDEPGVRRVLLAAVGAAAYQVLRGHGVWARRAYDAVTHGATREQVRETRAAGDGIGQAEWIDRLEGQKDSRLRRLKELPAAILAGAMVVVMALAAVGAVLLIGGTVVGVTRPLGWTWSGYWSLWATLAHLVVGAGVLLLWVGLACLVPLWAVAAHRSGATLGEVPSWLEPVRAIEDDSEPITPALVVLALRDLGLTMLRNAIRDMPDGGAGMLGQIVIAGCGVQVDVLLPSGVATFEIQHRRPKLAGNLHRHEHELHITIPKAARTVRLWIAESGALDEPVGPSPLVLDHDTTADYYNGRAPWGPNLRGDAVLVSLKQLHVLVTGLSNQGKTAALRALALWLAFDPSVEFWIADLKGIGDWGMFEGIATRLVEGPTDDHVAAATRIVEDAVTEIERRNGVVRASGSAQGVTRDMARSGLGLHPLVVVVDEAQIAFMCPKIDEHKVPYGGTKATSRFYMAVRKIENQGRAVNVTIWLGTQDPTNENLPKLVREAAHVRASLVLGTEAQARMAVGSPAVDAGAAPHKLRQGLDKGTLVVAGDGVEMPKGESSVTVRTHYIDGDDAAEVADRAKAARGGARVPVTEVEGPRDLLADLDEVLGDEQVRIADVPPLLRTLAPTTYEGLTGTALRQKLADHGVKVPSTNNVYPLDPATVRDALAGRWTPGGGQ